MRKTFQKLMIIQDSRVRSFTVALGVAFAFVSPTFISSFASAAEVTQRSIQLSSSSADAAGVTYTVAFTAATAAGAFVIDFCSNSPFIPSTCTAPTGFSGTSAASASSGFTDVTGSASKVVVAGTIAANDNVSVAISGIHNPTASGAFYARIVTYDTKQHALDNYDATDLGNATTKGWKDTGAAAISISDTIGVSAAVLETMTFCVAGPGTGGSPEIAPNCNVAGNSNPKPTIQLGEAVGSIKALSPSAVSTGDVYTQISTNAASGAIVNMKSSATGCGGLKRAGAPTACDILPALNTDITLGQAKFGVKAVAATNGTGAAGSFAPVSGGYYNDTTFALRYVAGDATGITSPYGDPFLDTAGAPANNKNMRLTFGASVGNSTPAGNYSADVSLIATGKF